MIGFCTCHNTDDVFVNDNNTFISIFTIFCTPIPTLIEVFTLIKFFVLAWIPVLGLLEKYIEKNLYKATKMTLKLFV